MRGMDRRMVQAKVAGGEALKRECKINEAEESGIAGHSLITSMPSALLGFMGCRNWTVPFPNMAVRRESGEGTQGLGTSNDRKVWGRVSSSSARGAGRDGQGSRVGRRRPPPPSCRFPIFLGLLGLCKCCSAPEHPAAAGEQLNIVNGFEKSPGGDGSEDVSRAVPLHVSLPHAGLLNCSSYTKKSKT